MLLRTEVRSAGGSLVTLVPDEVAESLGLSDGMELFWLADDHGGCRVVAGGEKTRRIVHAHEDAIADYQDVFRELVK
jgi:antitoxin component of MazEF toxin-antitoxin module